MSQPVQNLCDIRQRGPLRQGRTVDHQHRHAKRPRGVQLGARAGAACVLGHHQFNPMLLHQRLILRNRERPARDNHVAMRQRQMIRFIDQPQQVTVLGLGSKVFKMHPTDGQKDALRRTGQRGHRAIDIRDAVPLIAALRFPCRAGQCSQWHSGFAARRDSVAAHLRGKGVGGINHMGHCVVPQIAHQPLGTAESSDTHRQGLRARIFHAPGVGVGGWNTLFGYSFGQGISLGRAAKDQEMCHA